MKERSDAQLWTEMLSGEVAALEQIYRLYVDLLFDYGNKISRDADLTEDCIQNLFIDLWDKRGRLGMTDNIKAYLFLSLRRRIYRQLDKNKRSTELHNEENDFVLTLTPESQLIQEEDSLATLNSLQQALEQLNEQQREIIYLKYQRNLKSQEIAEILGIKDQSVRNALHRSITKLKKLMIPVFLLSTIGRWLYLLIEQ